MSVFPAKKPPEKHTLVLLGAVCGGPQKNILMRTRAKSLDFVGDDHLPLYA